MKFVVEEELEAEDDMFFLGLWFVTKYSGTLFMFTSLSRFQNIFIRLLSIPII
jgi:hypothetical protein